MKRTIGLFAAAIVVALACAWLVQAASEDANPAKHVRSLLVNTSGEAVTPATETSVAAKACATALTTVTKATWTAIPAGGQTYLVVNATSATSANTATVTVWGSPDGGTTQRVLLRADTLAPAKAVSVAVGTAAGPDTTTFTDAFAVLRAGYTHIYIQQTAVGTDNFVYGVAGF